VKLAWLLPAASVDRPPGQGLPADLGSQHLAGRAGAPWRDLPCQYGVWKTVASRCYRWRRQGVFDRLFAEVRRQADAARLLWL